MFSGGCFGSGYGGFYGISPFLMMIPMIIFWAILIFFIYKLYSHNRSAQYQSSTSSAIDRLSERFARGEINEEEYITKKKQLRK